MDSYISSIDNKRRMNSLNTCIKSLNTMIDLHEFDDTKQNFTEIVYSGPVGEISSATINYPRDAGFSIPIIAYVASLPIIVGYTNGKTLSITSSSIEELNKETTTTTSKTEEVSSGGEDSVDVVVDINKLPNGVAKTIKTTTVISYKKEEKEGEIITTWYKTTTITVSKTVDYSEAEAVILERF